MKVEAGTCILLKPGTFSGTLLQNYNEIKISLVIKQTLGDTNTLNSIL